jgi:hypothetical protein
MIAVQLKGGLGNQLFQYALGRTLALQHRTELLFDTSLLYNRVPEKTKTFYQYELDLFEPPARIATAEDFPQYSSRFSTRNRLTRGLHLLNLRLHGLRYVMQRKFEFDPRVLASPDNVYLDGYWQTEKYFRAVAPQIRADLAFRHKLGPEARRMHDRMQATNAVCVHIRRGDYLEILGHMGVVGSDYVQSGIRLLAERFSGLHFYIFSNDPKWCIENLRIAAPHTFITPENAGNNDREHMMLMSSCRHFVIANSTYSWWAAWLSPHPEKVVIGPKQWAADPHKNTSDVLPEGWLRL